MPESGDNENQAAKTRADVDLVSIVRSLGAQSWMSWLASKCTWMSRFLLSKPTYFLGGGGIIASLASFVIVRVAPHVEDFWKSSDELPKLGLVVLLAWISGLVARYASQRSRQRFFKDMAEMRNDQELRLIDYLVASLKPLESNPVAAKLVETVLDGSWTLDDQKRVLQTGRTPHGMYDASSTLPRNMADLDSRQAGAGKTTEAPAGESATA